MMVEPRSKANIVSLSLLAGLAVALSGCVSFGGKAPVSMLTLSADAAVVSGANKSGTANEALVVLIPNVPRKIDTNRIMVQIDSGNVAYLKESVWTDKPAVLMQQLLAETLAAKSDRLVLNEVETGGKAENFLSGQLVEFGIDASNMQAIAIFDAVKIRKGQPIEKRRFEAKEGLTKVEPAEAGEALNAAANKLAADIAAWLSAS
jgi:cholesterol transport system auxiliary component